jgi:RNA:NAD 2'-phosphotransferase (TPT1/KptA family)
MIFQEEVERLSDISIRLLQELEPEPVYVKEYIKEVCRKIQEEGWLEQKGEKSWVKTFERERYTLRIAFIHARRGARSPFLRSSSVGVP